MACEAEQQEVEAAIINRAAAEIRLVIAQIALMICEMEGMANIQRETLQNTQKVAKKALRWLEGKFIEADEVLEIALTLGQVARLMKNVQS